MKGGRLKIVNESRYPTDEVEALVRFGLSEIDLTGERIVAVVKNTRPTKRRGGLGAAISGLAYSLSGGIPRTLYDRYCGKRTLTHHLILLRVGPPEVFPRKSWRRYAGVEPRVMRDWREGLVAITAHEAMHSQHSHDNAYRSKSGRRRPAMFEGQPVARGAKVRIGSERIEPKCEAFEGAMLRRYRESELCHNTSCATM